MKRNILQIAEKRKVSFINTGWQNVNKMRMSEDEANSVLSHLWETGQVPKNFYHGHSEYSRALADLKKNGHIEWCDFF